MNSSGRFAVIWQADSYGTPRSVAQFFDASRVRVGSLINNITPRGTTNYPELAAMSAAGDLTFTFARSGGGFSSVNGNTVAQYNASDVYVRQISASGTLSEAQIVSAQTAGIQTSPSVAQTPNGFVVSWLSSIPGGGQGMFTQQFQKPIVTSSNTQSAATTNSISSNFADYLYSLPQDELVNKKSRNTL